KCIGVLAQYGQYLSSYHAKTNFVFNWRSKAKVEGGQIIGNALGEGRAVLLEHEAKRLLHLHDIPVFQDRLATSAEEAEKIAARIGGRVAMKIVSPDILHKTDAGGVRLNLSSKKGIGRAFQGIMASARRYNKQADIRGVVIAPMAEAGMEVIVGTKIDDQFGPVIMFGMGGVLVEILKDVAFRVLPISPATARHMIDEIHSAPLLDGYRGQPPCDKKALRKVLLKCSELIESYPEIQEMDLNPVIVHEKGISIVDARILLKPPGADFGPHGGHAAATVDSQ
ncbi:TPA: acyl-CoA synthetase, partial [Candidatus Micrarchaeota archaeon]|nr:acyl-CoA synthetase [Candidatus Micrarchaeota archaeon]